MFHLLSGKSEVTEEEFPFDEIDPRLLGLLDQVTADGKTLYALSPILELMHQGFMSRWPVPPKEPSASDVPDAKRVSLTRAHLPHHPPGTERLAKRIAAFPWVQEVRDHTRHMNTQRTHLLPRDSADPALVPLVYAHDSQPQGAVRLFVRTTARCEAEAAYVEDALRDLLAGL